MERWRRLAILGGAGAVALCLGLLLAPTLYNFGSLTLARWRWARHGGSAYTVVVTQLCNCYETGVYRLTIRRGRVTAVEVLGAAALSAFAPPPGHFEHLSVEEGFERASRDLRANWLPSLRRRLLIEYDPDLGYVTRFESGDPSAPHFFFAYTAQDLQLLPP